MFLQIICIKELLGTKDCLVYGIWIKIKHFSSYSFIQFDMQDSYAPILVNAISLHTETLHRHDISLVNSVTVTLNTKLKSLVNIWNNV